MTGSGRGPAESFQAPPPRGSPGKPGDPPEEGERIQKVSSIWSQNLVVSA